MPLLGIEIQETSPQPQVCSIADMPLGSIGRQHGTGYLYYRTYESAACLDKPGHSYTHARSVDGDRPEHMVTLLRPGTKIILTVG